MFPNTHPLCCCVSSCLPSAAWYSSRTLQALVYLHHAAGWWFDACRVDTTRSGCSKSNIAPLGLEDLKDCKICLNKHACDVNSGMAVGVEQKCPCVQCAHCCSMLSTGQKHPPKGACMSPLAGIYAVTAKQPYSTHPHFSVTQGKSVPHMMRSAPKVSTKAFKPSIASG